MSQSIARPCPNNGKCGSKNHTNPSRYAACEAAARNQAGGSATPKRTPRGGVAPAAFPADTLAKLRTSRDQASPFMVSNFHEVPEGHFTVTTKMLGITREYLLKGEQDDPTATIVGRTDMTDSSGGIKPTFYRGNRLMGGTPLFGAEGYEDAYAQMID